MGQPHIMTTQNHGEVSNNQSYISKMKIIKDSALGKHLHVVVAVEYLCSAIWQFIQQPTFIEQISEEKIDNSGSDFPTNQSNTHKNGVSWNPKYKKRLPAFLKFIYNLSKSWVTPY